MGYPLIPERICAPNPELRLRFLEIVRRRLRERRYSRRTEQAYVHWIRRFVRFHGRRHPKELGEPEVIAFLSALAVEGRVAASTQKQAASALVFLYDRVVLRPLKPLGELRPLARQLSCRRFFPLARCARYFASSCRCQGCARR